MEQRQECALCTVSLLKLHAANQSGSGKAERAGMGHCDCPISLGHMGREETVRQASLSGTKHHSRVYSHLPHSLLQNPRDCCSLFPTRFSLSIHDSTHGSLVHSTEISQFILPKPTKLYQQIQSLISRHLFFPHFLSRLKLSVVSLKQSIRSSMCPS
jgi:hypothetical protein